MIRRLLLSYLSVTVLVLLLLEIPLGLFYARWERQRLSAGLSGDASVLATLYEDALELGADLPADTPVALDAAPALAYQDRTGARVVVVDADGTSLVDTEQPALRSLGGRPEIATALDGTRSSGTRYSETLRTELFYVAVPVASSGRVYGAVRVSLDTAALDAHVRRFHLGLVAVAAVVLATMTAPVVTAHGGSCPMASPLVACSGIWNTRGVALISPFDGAAIASSSMM